MKILHLSTSDSGGAGIAAVRLHKGLLAAGIDSKIMTLHKSTNDIQEHYQFFNSDTIKDNLFAKVINKLKLKAREYGFTKDPYRSAVEKNLKNQPPIHEMFSFPFSDFDLTKHSLVKQADIINIHWVSGGYLDYKSFFRNNKKKIVWTLHDMNPFTGGCHYSEDYLGYTEDCSHCPQLKNTIDEDYASKMLKLKKKIFGKINYKDFLIVTPSCWLKDCVSQSILFKRFKAFVIANGFSEKVFFPVNKKSCRKQLRLPENKLIVLFAAQSISSERKGMKYLLEALGKMDNKKEILLCSMGGTKKTLVSDSSILNLGYIPDEKTASAVYNAADVFVSPALHDNFPNTICEALMCGTPVVAFNVGGVSEQIIGETGMLVPAGNVEALKSGIDFILENPGLYKKETVSRIATDKWNLNLQAEKYINIYKLLFREN